MTTATCIKCGQPFQYDPIQGRNRRVCLACLKANRQSHNKRWTETRRRLPSEDRADQMYKAGLLGMSQEEVAWRLRIPLRSVEYIERMALNKIRKDPKAKALFAVWKSEGAPTPGAQREAGEILLEWQMEMSQWRELQERLAAKGLTEEAEEVGRLEEDMEGKVRGVMKEILKG